MKKFHTFIFWYKFFRITPDVDDGHGIVKAAFKGIRMAMGIKTHPSRRFWR